MTDYKFFPEIKSENMDPGFMDRLMALRVVFDRPMKVTSSFRDPEENKRVGGVRNSTHLEGWAVDIAISGHDALELICLAYKMGFTGIGLRQHGKRRFVHLDIAPDSHRRPRPHIWTYP